MKTETNLTNFEAKKAEVPFEFSGDFINYFIGVLSCHVPSKRWNAALETAKRAVLESSMGVK